MSLRQNLAVKIVTGYVILAFVIMEILYLGVWCRPFHEYWAVPTDSGKQSAMCLSVPPPLRPMLISDSPMLRGNTSSYHKRCSQHLLRPYDHLDPHARLSQGRHLDQEEDHPLQRLHRWCIHSTRPR